MYYTVDRIADGIAVLEDDSRQTLELPVAQLPSGVREGDCLRQTADGQYQLDPDEAGRRRDVNKQLFEQLKKRKPPNQD